MEVENKFGNASPILIFGIILFVLGSVSNINLFKWVPNWITGVGILFIIIGVIHSIIKMVSNK